MNYYIADTHFGHENILQLSHRPFINVEQMDETIIENWNKRVTNDDHIFILGDLAYKGKPPEKYLSRLNGKKHLIIGNHDKRITDNYGFYRKFFVEITPMKSVNDNGTKIVLCHYPLVEWDGYYRDTLHFYGHVHNTFHNENTLYAAGMNNAYNVGVDIIGFEPKTLQEIIKGKSK